MEKQSIRDVISSLRGWLLSVAGISLVVNLLAFTGPLFMLQVYDRVLASGSVPTLLALGFLTLVLYLFFGVLEGLRSRILLRIGQQVDVDLSAQAYALSTRVPVNYGARGHSVRPVQDLDSVTAFMSGSGPSAVFDVPWLPVYLSVIFLFHTTLGVVALLGAIAISLLVVLNEFVSRTASADAAQTRTRRATLVEESRTNAEVVTAMGMQNALSERWNAENDIYLAGQRAAADWSGFFATAIKTVRFVLQSGILAVGAWLAIKQEISPGVMIASSIMMSRALAPVEQAVSHWRGFIGARQSFRRLKEFMELAPNVEQVTQLRTPSSNLKIDKLYCAPAGVREPVIMGASMALNAGEGIAVLGPSGSGKSTLAKAIVGAATISNGEVRLDGAALDQWDDEARKRFVGYLPQDLQLFDGTVAQNISRFDSGATSDEIVAAATQANVHELIVGLPKGYDTLIGAQGVALSGGEKQRIALARALFRNPFLLVLDEPNSNLDADGEAALADALLAMRQRGSIIVLIAHRPRALASVDKVLLLKEGRVAAIGPKEEVLRSSIAPVKASQQC
ncbi:type I secretion system permease/ATPase [Hoeflea poritis]|uniref:Type I secretion system permease/ATPase n=1 Tax=Hoeflea poritis TaxID=2993659 RepID=A0ABT4VK89_9HYPH|nr:type I secretion system permease/ATPase [Hoeflea poritis]MDA4845133.1 type I secretion system permease/ATPase [Hoeflea poritis]